MTIKEIKNDCRRRALQTMNKTAVNAKDVLDTSFEQYYAGGLPKRYKRTRNLTSAADLQGPKVSGDNITLDAGYASSHMQEYQAGDFKPQQVLDATMHGTSGVVGDPSYDEVALERIIDVAEKNFNSEFSRH